MSAVQRSVAGRNRNLLAQLGQRTKVLNNRLCLSEKLKILALSSVQLSCSVKTALLLALGTSYHLCQL